MAIPIYQNYNPSSPVQRTAESHVVDASGRIRLKHIPLKGVGGQAVTISGYTETTSSNPGLTEFYIDYQDITAYRTALGYVQFSLSAAAATVTVNYYSVSTIIWAEDLNEIGDHIADGDLHVGTGEKAAWDGKAEVADIPTAANDTFIGNRTVDPAISTTASNAGTLTFLLSWLAKMVKAITGKTNWYDTPDTTIASLNSGKEPALGNPDADGKVLSSTAAGVRSWIAAASGGADVATVIASLPAHYGRDRLWANAGSDTAANRRSLVSPSRLSVNINNGGYILTAAVTKDLDTAANWDAATYATAANRAGKDFYVYACVPGSGTVPVIVLSANSTVPAGYSAATSRKIGGFHCLCVSVGTIASHTLTGYLAGDILPQSVWDIRHRPASNPEGMVFDGGSGKWVDIYLASVSSGELASINAATIADGVSATAFHWYNFQQWFGRLKKRPLWQHEFHAASMGANQGTNIAGSADPGTTTGHTNTAGRRMISNIGCEDTCGVLSQWGLDTASAGTASWVNAYDGNDTGVGGQHYMPPNRVLLGGYWGGGADCGSRGSGFANGPLDLSCACACRGCAEPGIPLA